MDGKDIVNVPEYVVHAEDKILGALIASPDIAVPAVLEILDSGDFSSKRNQVLYGAIASLVEEGTKPERSIVSARLRHNEELEIIGGAERLSEIATPGECSAAVVEYCDIVRDFALRNRLQASAHQIATMATNRDISAEVLLDQSVEMLATVGGRAGSSGVMSMQDAAAQWSREVADVRAGHGGITTGYPVLDAYVRGLQGNVVVIAALPGLGKCLGKDTPLLMHDGSIKLVQDVERGDLLMGPDSSARTVMSTVTGRGELYQVTPIKGDPYVVNEDHILSLKYSGKPGIRNMSIKEYLKLGDGTKARMKGWRTEVDWPEKAVAIDPYILGIWLGDGNSSRPMVYTMDKEVVTSLYEFAEREGLVCVPKEEKGKAMGYSLKRKPGVQKNSFLDKLRAYSVLKNKHIPQAYLINSRKTRLQMLAGLLDSDGHLFEKCFEIVQVRERLARQIAFLARSLGFAAYLKEVEKTCTNTGATGTYWKVAISGNTHLIPSRVAHKTAAERKQIKDVLVSGIKVTPIGEGDYYGFQIDKDKLFLLGDFTVTHNSAFGLNMVWNQATAGIPVAIISLEMTSNAVAERLLQIEGRCTSEELERDPSFASRLADQLAEKPIRIAAMGSTSSGAILRQMRILEQQGVKSFFVDYLQLITDKKAERRDLEVSNPLRMFIQFVKRSNLSVITASQAKRDAITGGDGGAPKMWQMKESSGIEAHADIIWGLGTKSYIDAKDTTAPLYLEILKSRKRGFVGTRIPFVFDRSRQLIQASVQVF